MSKIELPLAEAITIVESLKQEMAPECERIEIAGSVRRCKEVIGDLELVAIPKRDADLFGGPGLSRLDPILDRMVQEGRLARVKGKDKYKQFLIPQVPGLQLDLFLTTPEEWGVRFTLSTGSASFNQKLVTQRNKRGILPSDLYIEHNRVWRVGETDPLQTPEEEDVFDLIGGWIDPWNRD